MEDNIFVEPKKELGHKVEVKFTFDFDEPEDKKMMRRIVSDEATSWQCLVWDLDQEIRKIVKYEMV